MGLSCGQQIANIAAALNITDSKENKEETASKKLEDIVKNLNKEMRLNDVFVASKKTKNKLVDVDTIIEDVANSVSESEHIAAEQYSLIRAELEEKLRGVLDIRRIQGFLTGYVRHITERTVKDEKGNDVKRETVWEKFKEPILMFTNRVPKTKKVKRNGKTVEEEIKDASGNIVYEFVLKKEVLDSMAVTLIDFLANSSDQINRENEMKKILGLEQEDFITNMQYDALKNVTGEANKMYNMLGSTIFKQLGLEYKKGQTAQLAAKINVQLGQMLMLGADKMEFISLDYRQREKKGRNKEGVAIDKGGYQKGAVQIKSEIFGENVKSDNSPFIATYKVNEEKIVPAKLEEYRTANKALTKLLDSETSVRNPTEKPSPDTTRGQTTGATAGMVTSSEIHSDALEKMRNNKMHLNPLVLEMYRFLAQPVKNPDGTTDYNPGFLALKQGLTQTGFTNDTARVHVNRKAGVEGKNKAIIEDLRNADEFTPEFNPLDNGGKLKPFYISSTVNSSNLRFTSVPNGFDPHNKKLHRAMVYFKKVNVMKNLDSFKLGIAQALGFSIDKYTTPASLRAFDDLVKEFRDNVLVHEDGSDEQRNAILKMIDIGDPHHAMLGVAELKAYLWALDESEKGDKEALNKLESAIPVETDAVTSGYILKMLQLPVFRKMSKDGKMKLDIDKIKLQLRKGGIIAAGEYLGVDTSKIKKVLKAAEIAIENEEVIPYTALTELSRWLKDTKKYDGKTNIETLNDKNLLDDGELETLQNALLDSYEYPAKKMGAKLSQTINVKAITEDRIKKSKKEIDEKKTIYGAQITAKQNKVFVDLLVGSENVKQDSLGNWIVNVSRAFMKDPFMIFNYGAGIKRIVENKVELVMDKLLYNLVEDKEKGFENLINTLEASKVYGNDIVNNAIDAEVKRLKNEYNKIQNNENVKAEQAKAQNRGHNKQIGIDESLAKMQIDPKVLGYVKNKARNVYKPAMTEVFNEEYKELIEATNSINSSMTTMFKMMMLRIDRKKKEYTDKFGREPDIKEVEAWVNEEADAVPAIRAALGDKNDQEQRVMILDSEPTTFEKKDDNGFPLSETGQAATKLADGTKINGEGLAYRLAEAYSKGSVLFIHNIDATAIAQILKIYKVLGIHDAALYALDDVEAGSLEYNKIIAKISREFSISNEVVKAFNANMDAASVEELVALDKTMIEKSIDENDSINKRLKIIKNSLKNSEGENKKGIKEVFDVINEMIQEQKKRILNSASSTLEDLSDYALSKKVNLNDQKVTLIEYAESLKNTFDDTTLGISKDGPYFAALELIALLSNGTKKGMSNHVERLGKNYAQMLILNEEAEEGREALRNNSEMHFDHVAYAPSIYKEESQEYKRMVPEAIEKEKLNAMKINEFKKDILDSRQAVEPKELVTITEEDGDKYADKNLKNYRVNTISRTDLADDVKNINQRDKEKYVNILNYYPSKTHKGEGKTSFQKIKNRYDNAKTKGLSLFFNHGSKKFVEEIIDRIENETLKNVLAEQYMNLGIKASDKDRLNIVFDMSNENVQLLGSQSIEKIAKEVAIEQYPKRISDYLRVNKNISKSDLKKRFKNKIITVINPYFENDSSIVHKILEEVYAEYWGSKTLNNKKISDDMVDIGSKKTENTDETTVPQDKNEEIIIDNNSTFEDMQKHPKFEKHLEERQNVSSKDIQYAQRQVQKRTGTENYHSGAINEPNYNADFEITKRDVNIIRNAIKNGKSLKEETLNKLRNDLGRYQNDPLYADIKDSDIDSSLLGSSNDALGEIHSNSEGIASTLAEVAIEAEEIDKEVLGDNFKQEEANQHKLTIAQYLNVLNDAKDIAVKIVTDSAREIAEGIYDPKVGSVGGISISLGSEERESPVARNEMTNLEVIAHEMTHAAVHWAMKKDNMEASKPRGLILRLYSKARKNTTWRDLLPESEGLYIEKEETIAQDMYRHIFGINPDGTSVKGWRVENGWDEFMAHMKTNKEFGAAMEKIHARTALAPKYKGDSSTLAKFIEKIFTMVRNAMDVVFKTGDKIYKNDSIKSATNRLIMDMIKAKDAQHRRIHSSAKQNIVGKTLHMGSKAVDKSNEMMRPIINTLTGIILGDSDNELTREEVKKLTTLGPLLPKDTDHPFVKLSKTLILLPRVRLLLRGNHRSKQMNEKMGELEKQLFRSADFMKIKALSELAGDFFTGSKEKVKMTDRIMKVKASIDAVRESAIQGGIRDVFDSFTEIDLSDDKNRKYDEVLTPVVLRTDMQSLDMSIDEIAKLLESEDTLKDALAIEEEKIGKHTIEGDLVGNRQLIEADSLADYMMTGKGVITNAENIARGFGRSRWVNATSTKNAKDLAKEIKTIDRYTTLKAMQKLGEKEKEVFLELVGKDPDGVRAFMEVAGGMQRKSMEEQVENHTYTHAKGFVRDSYENGTDVQYLINPNQKEMKDLGYEKVDVLEAARGDKSGDVEVWLKMNAINSNKVDGALLMQGKLSRGISLRDKINSDINKPLAEKNKEFAKQFQALLNRWTENGDAGGAYPVYAADGSILDFMYTTSLDVKIGKARLETRGSVNMGNSFGLFGTYEESMKANKDLMDYLIKDSADNYINDPQMYVEISPTQIKNAEAKVGQKEFSGDINDVGIMWAMIPKEIRDYLKQINGDKKLYVRKELARQIFGYNELSIAGTKIAQKLFKAKGLKNIRFLEKIWKDIGSIAKNLVIVKLPKVMFGNLRGNATLTLIQGFNPIKVARELWTAWSTLDAYEADVVELGRLKRKKNRESYKVRINELEERLKRNPHYKFVEAGMYQSISAETNVEKEGHNLIENFLNKQKAKLPKSAQTALNIAFLTKETRYYKFMEKMTMRSDYLFKYATYNLTIEKGMANPGYLKPGIQKLAKEAGKPIPDDFKWNQPIDDTHEIYPYIEQIAWRNSIDNHVNYSGVLSPLGDYADKMLVIPFFKYFSRMQRVDYRLIKEYPTNALITMYMQSHLGMNMNNVLSDFIGFGGAGGKLNVIDNSVGLAGTAAAIPIQELYKEF